MQLLVIFVALIGTQVMTIWKFIEHKKHKKVLQTKKDRIVEISWIIGEIIAILSWIIFAYISINTFGNTARADNKASIYGIMNWMIIVLAPTQIVSFGIRMYYLRYIKK